MPRIKVTVEEVGSLVQHFYLNTADRNIERPDHLAHAVFALFLGWTENYCKPRFPENIVTKSDQIIRHAREHQQEIDAADCAARLRGGEVNNETMYGKKTFYKDDQ